MTEDPIKPPDAPMVAEDYAVEKPPAPGGRLRAAVCLGMGVLMLVGQYRSVVYDGRYWIAPAIVTPLAMFLGLSGMAYPGIFDHGRMFEDRLVGERIAIGASVVAGAVGAALLLAFLDGMF